MPNPPETPTASEPRKPADFVVEFEDSFRYQHLPLYVDALRAEYNRRTVNGGVNEALTNVGIFLGIVTAIGSAGTVPAAAAATVAAARTGVVAIGATKLFSPLFSNEASIKALEDHIVDRTMGIYENQFINATGNLEELLAFQQAMLARPVKINQYGRDKYTTLLRSVQEQITNFSAEERQKFSTQIDNIQALIENRSTEKTLSPTHPATPGTQASLTPEAVEKETEETNKALKELGIRSNAELRKELKKDPALGAQVKELAKQLKNYEETRIEQKDYQAWSSMFGNLAKIGQAINCRSLTQAANIGSGMVEIKHAAFKLTKLRDAVGGFGAASFIDIANPAMAMASAAF